MITYTTNNIHNNNKKGVKMAIVKITKTIFEKINGKKLINFNIKENEMEIEYKSIEECEILKKLDELDAELDAGEGIELEFDELDNRYPL
jgi:hypothetical protein